MDRKTKDSLLNLAADLIVLPITAFVAVKRATDYFNESDTGKKVKAYARQAGEEISAAAKKAAESETFQSAKAKFDEFTAKAGDIVKEYTDGASAKFTLFRSTVSKNKTGN